jgi:hypothetical protein
MTSGEYRHWAETSCGVVTGLPSPQEQVDLSDDILAAFRWGRSGNPQRMSEVLDIVSIMPSYTYKDGQMVEIPDTVVSEDTEIREPISNTLVLRPGVVVTAFAAISGTVRLMPGATLEARGDVSGTVNVERDARAVFHGRAGGTIKIDLGAEVHLLPRAVALGVIHVEGTLVNEGTRGVNLSGPGIIDDRDGSRVRSPDRTLADGTTIYES